MFSVAEAVIVERNSFRWHVRNRSMRTMIANLTTGEAQKLRLVRWFALVIHKRNEFRSTIFLAAMIAALSFLSPHEARAWGRGHRLIRLWAVARLPEWQQEWIGPEHLDRLCRDFTSLQDQHAGGDAPELDPYCIVPGVRLSLHDVNPAEPSFQGKRWYLERIAESLDRGWTEEAMKYLGVLCHWNEDPGCPSAHCSPVTEWQLKTLIPPPKDKQNLNYLYGYGGIADVGDYQIPDEPYRPRLLGTTRDEAAARIYQHQRILRRNAAARIVPLVQDMVYGDGTRAKEQRAAAALENGRHVADIIYTALCLAAGRIEPEEAELWQTQPLTAWKSEFTGGRVGPPYHVSPFLVDQAMDADRRLHPLALPDGDGTVSVDSGYGMGAPFALRFTLTPAGVFERFTCRVGLHPTAGPEGEVAFAVLAGDQELVRTRPLRAGEPPESIDVRLPAKDVLKLTLQTIPSDPAASRQNLTVWAGPTLHRTRRE